jgi:hypothetical protein
MLDLSGIASAFAYLPGVGIAVGLIVTGNLLATAYARYALKAERKSERRLFRWVRHRAHDDLPWPMWGLALASHLPSSARWRSGLETVPI